MAEQKKKFISEAGGKEIVDQILAIIEELATNDALQAALANYTNTTDMNAAIKAAVDASEKKIFGDGELAEAFDTIKEIGDYLKDHDEVAEAINQAIAQKLGKEEAEGIYQKIADMANYVTSTSLSSTLAEYAKTSEVEGMLEEYAKSEDVVSNETYQADKATFATKAELAEIEPDEVPVADIQGWFKKD
ncbi:MAG: hypothetical protein J1F67_05215 [Muribaculaceae bacterium]|nr:hypothetical protein [Muribaculaceae bacterium]